jgi:hypothetical protein
VFNATFNNISVIVSHKKGDGKEVACKTTRRNFFQTFENNGNDKNFRSI